MLGPIGSNIMSIFRLLSPDEIDRYIESKEGVRKVEGTMVAGGEEFTSDEHQVDYSSQNSKKEEDKFPADHQAEIIPIGKKKNQDKEEPDQNQQNNPESNQDISQKAKKVSSNIQSAVGKSSGSGLESIGVLSASTLREIEEERFKEEQKKQDSTTAFLIKERMKMRESKKRLIEQHALKQYQVNVAQEFYANDEEDYDEDEANDASAKGILINKKQF